MYHSVYDSFYWYTHFSDGDFTHTAGLSRVIGTALMRLADADILPFEFGSTATHAERLCRRDRRSSPATHRRALDLKPLRKSIDALARRGREVRIGARQSASVEPRRRRVADRAESHALPSERAFRYEAGLPRRDWFKHLAYAPGFYTGYGVKTLPGIREALEQKQLDEARQFVPIVSASVDRLRDDVEKATSLVSRLPRK